MSITGAASANSGVPRARSAMTISRKSLVDQIGLRSPVFTAVLSLCGGQAVARAWAAAALLVRPDARFW